MLSAHPSEVLKVASPPQLRATQLSGAPAPCRCHLSTHATPCGQMCSLTDTFLLPSRHTLRQQLSAFPAQHSAALECCLHVLDAPSCSLQARLPDTARSICAHVRPNGPRVSGSRVAAHTCAASASAGVDFASYSPERMEEARCAATAALQEKQSADQDGAVATSLRSAAGFARRPQWHVHSAWLRWLQVADRGLTSCAAPPGGLQVLADCRQSEAYCLLAGNHCSP